MWCLFMVLLVRIYLPLAAHHYTDSFELIIRSRCSIPINCARAEHMLRYQTHAGMVLIGFDECPHAM